MDSINPQVTDAVTPANTKTLGESPASAISQLYEALAYSMGIAFQNAVSAQQQMNAISQAATNQGVVLLFSSDTLTSALSDPSLVAAIGRQHSDVQATLQAEASGLNEQIIQSVIFSNAATLDNADAFAHALRVSTGAAVAALGALDRVNRESQSALLKNAARAACVACMLRAPDKAAEYAQVLASIEALA